MNLLYRLYTTFATFLLPLAMVNYITIALKFGGMKC